jgi:hypothetical protein
LFKELAISKDGGAVDYTKLQGSEIYQWFQGELTPQLQQFNPDILTTPSEKLAFWINLYNALVIDAVIRLNISKSVTQGALGVVRFFRKAAYQIGGYRLSLEDIEHGILRGNQGHPYIPGKQFNSADPRLSWIIRPSDPRIHFALNCASNSCPPIGFYSAEKIETQLEIASQNFITQEVRFKPTSNILELSRIFQWYAIDFGGKQGVLAFVAKYLHDAELNQQIETSAKIIFQYQPYDWQLNIA